MRVYLYINGLFSMTRCTQVVSGVFFTTIWVDIIWSNWHYYESPLPEGRCLCYSDDSL